MSCCLEGMKSYMPALLVTKMLRTGGVRVSVRATCFDEEKDNSWSLFHFGDQWQSARCYGVVKNIIKSKNCATVLWEIDKNISKIAVDALRIEDCCVNDLPGNLT